MSFRVQPYLTHRSIAVLSFQREAQEASAVKRRDFITLTVGAAAWPLAARAQSPAILRVGMVSAQPRSSSISVALVQRLAELGYEQGRNLGFEFIQAAKFEEYMPAYQELVRRGSDILVASITPDAGANGAR
jgi:putative tryptophan/tyrosine transport system substrate-binding protein